VLAEFADRAGITRAEWVLESRKRGRPAVSSEAPVVRQRLAAEASGGAADAVCEFDSISEEIRHLRWWDDVSYSDGALVWVPTLTKVPPQMASALADAKSAVVLALAAAQRGSELECRLWKTFMDRLLLAQPRRRGGKKHGHQNKSLTNMLSHRLRLFWRGDWGSLWDSARS
jgi:hypothetical protein